MSALDVSSTEEDDGAVFSGEEEEEWCGFCFYFVKQFAFDDPEIKAKINEADNEIYQCNTERIHIANTLKSKRVERLSLVSSFDEYNAMVYNVEKDQEVVKEEIKNLSGRVSEISMEIEFLDARLSCVLDQRDKAFEKIKFLRMKRDKANAAYFQSRVVMKRALELAASGNVRDLEELADSEVDRFMSRWNNEKAFREDYEKRVLHSLDERKLSRDGRIRSLEGYVDTEKAIELKRFSIEEESDDDAMDVYIPVYDRLGEEEEETLKEKKREEQLEKARLAMERKRKLHEKAAAKAAIRVKKEAEKKLKQREKRAKKKATSSDADKTITETVTGVSSEQEKEKVINRRSVFPKHRSFRYRHHGKGNESVPIAILKRRKAYRLWLWTVSSAVVAFPLALLVLFFYVR
ncbi:hypothetical protein AALP_AA8G218000 [Arabis alpina]|uniref:Uncharacterized protein n=1 Tax=Arabis alpina TaxID=50452 RepID=A0A087G8L7_ARAAL|nr:hypothetical protein AALP_AA8G218000 [Arabis alpina]